MRKPLSRDANRDAGLLLPKPGTFHAVLREPTTEEELHDAR